MIFNRHSELQGLHAFLSPSSPHWLNYTEEKLLHRYTARQAASRGTRIHNWAAEAISLGITQADDGKTVSMYVNDCIGWRMKPEVGLFYSINCFGHADALGFRKNTLRISDLKNGITQANMRQLKVYAALFCLEYKIKPEHIKIELRIYQSNEVKLEEPDPGDIAAIMEGIVHMDKLINNWEAEEADA